MLTVQIQFVGIIAVNAASIKPLFSTSKWLSSKGNSSGPPASDGVKSHPLVTIGGGGSSHTPRHGRSNNYTDIDNSSEENFFKPDLSHIETSGRQTKISASDLEAGHVATDVGQGPRRNNKFPGGIVVTTQVDVRGDAKMDG